MDIKNEVLYRVYVLLFGIIVPVSMVLIYKTVYISWWEGERWRSQSKNTYVQYRPVEAEKGNIMADDGSLLATSIPYFDIYMDPNSTGMTEESFMDNVDSLAHCLATYVDNSYTVGGYREHLIESRAAGERYLLIKKKVSYSEKRFIEHFPLFELGQIRGGFIAEKRSERKRPFGWLAQRTIGYIREGAKPVGLEGYFQEVIGGEAGKQLMIKVDGDNDIWLPLHDLSTIEPKSGNDILTTIDINLQDITEEALLRAMNYHDAEWGTAIVMEVKTGAVKAIANLGRTTEGWWETYNNAVGSATEPGSTFKLATIMALLEDGFVNLEDSIDIEKGKTEFYEETMEDSSPFSFKIDSTSVQRAFEISSNVGMAKLVQKYYGQRTEANDNKGAEMFIERLKSFNLHLPVGIEIPGEANPYIKEAYNEADDNWSGTTLPWMSIGYELEVTPLQLLTLYNAVANDGMMMKPYLVSEIQRFGEVLEEFKPTVIKKRIASQTTIELAQELLEAVVENGTAYKLKTDRYRFAGKTGTAQTDYRRYSRGTRVGGYQASFAGYFPANKPLYSCIVVINKPRQNGFYGSEVAGPVFREIADKCFMSKFELHPAINAARKPQWEAKTLPRMDVGRTADLAFLLGELDIPFYGSPTTELAVLDNLSDSLIMEKKSLIKDIVPNVVGMGLRDALFILENKGLEVEVSGVGKVVRQSIRSGTQIRGQTIKLTLG